MENNRVINKAGIVCVFCWMVVACPFYVSIWTSTDTKLSERWFLTGLVCLAQFAFSLKFYYTAKSQNS